MLPLTETIREQRQELMAQVAKAWVQKHYAQELQQERASCPHCGLPLRRWGFAPRTVETLIGTFPLERPYFYGRACQAGFCPLDGVLGLAERDKQYDLQKAAVQVAPEMPYETASALFGELTKAETTGQRDNETAEGLGRSPDGGRGRAAGGSGR